MNTSPYPQPSYYLEPGENETINFKRYLSLFFSNWYWFAFSLFIAMSVAYGINRWSTRVFTVSSTMLIKADQNSALSNIFPGSDSYRNQQNLTNEMWILRSFDLNRRVMQQLPDFLVDYTKVGKRGIAEKRLYTDCPFVVVYDSANYQPAGRPVYIKITSSGEYKIGFNGHRNLDKTMPFGERFTGSGFNFRIMLRDSSKPAFDPDGSNKYYFTFNSPESLANSYRSRLSIVPVEENASLVTLSISGLVAQQQADYLNMLAKVYLQYGLDAKNETATKTIGFINEQLGKISDSLKVTDGELADFRRHNNILDLSSEGSLLQRRIEEADAEKSKLLLQKTYYEYLKNYVETKNETGDLITPSAMGVSDQLLMGLVNELAQAIQQKKILSVNLALSTSPLTLANEKIAVLRKAIAENISDGLKNINDALNEAEKKINGISTSINRLPLVERQMINVQRKLDVNNTVYTYLLEKRAEAGIAQASNVPDNKQIDMAGNYSSYRIKPKEKQNLMVALALGLLVPLISILLIDYLNNKIIDKKDVERGTKAPIVGFVSHNRLKTELPVIENPGSTISESFRAVRTNLKYFVKDIKSPVISVSSTITAEGKTFISANLASIMAMAGKKVLLMGLDLRKPRIHRILGTANEKGISSFLIGEAVFEDILFKTRIENLWYAASGPVPPNPAELIDSDKMIEFINLAKERFDYIIIDTPPAAIVTDALLVSSLTDLYLFVVRQRYTSRSTLELIEELHNNKNIKSLGVVLNDINLSGYYGYGLRYGSYFGYGYNYGYNYYGYSGYGKYGHYESSKGYYKED
jgi:tyrosine-protein kinase Etk/Wzc